MIFMNVAIEQAEEKFKSDIGFLKTTCVEKESEDSTKSDQCLQDYVPKTITKVIIAVFKAI